MIGDTLSFFVVVVFAICVQFVREVPTMSSSAILVDDATSVLHRRYDRMMRLLAVGKFGKSDLDP